MKTRFRKALVMGVILFIIALVGLNVLAYRHAYAMMHFTTGGVRTDVPETLGGLHKLKVLFTGIRLPRPETYKKPLDVGPNCQSITIEATNGIKLGAWYCPAAAAATSPLVILFHGYGGEKCGALAESKVFLELGCSVLLVDFRGSGESSESYTSVGYCESEDVATAVKYAQDQLPHSRLVLYGQSMGAAAILRAVICLQVKPDAIVAEAVFDSLLTTVRNRFQAMKVPSFPSAELLVFWGGLQGGFNGFKLEPVKYAESVHCPILFMHGTDDPRARLAEAQRVYDAVPGSKKFLEFPGIHHESIQSRYPAEWQSAVGQVLTSMPQ